MDMTSAELENRIRDYVEREVGRQLTIIQGRLTATPSRSLTQWVVVGEENAPDYAVNWLADTTTPLSYWRDPLSNIVYARGAALYSGLGGTAAIFTLPPAYRPPYLHTFKDVELPVTDTRIVSLAADTGIVTVDNLPAGPCEVIFDGFVWGANVSTE